MSLRAAQPLFNVVTVQTFSFASEMATVSFAPTRIAVTTFHLGVDAVQGRILQHRRVVMIVLLVCVDRERLFCWPLSASQPSVCSAPSSSPSPGQCHRHPSPQPSSGPSVSGSPSFSPSAFSSMSGAPSYLSSSQPSVDSAPSS
jgi:hypothetical protein